MSGAPQPLDDALRKQALLREIGITEDVLISALDEGDAAAVRCTPNHPPLAAPIYRFSETVRSLAEQMARNGWTRRDYKNFSTIVRPDKRMAIAVASGDDGTGDLSADVTTRSPKGAVTYEVVNANFNLPLDQRYEEENKESKIRTLTWFLLHTRKDGQRVAELSLPKTIIEGFVQTWEPRIPLRQQTIDSITLDLSGGDPPVNPDVQITKKQ